MRPCWINKFDDRRYITLNNRKNQNKINSHNCVELDNIIYRSVKLQFSHYLKLLSSDVADFYVRIQNVGV